LSQTRKGLILTLGGAPNTPHFFPQSGLPGFYRPDAPTPVGADGEVELDHAKEAHDGPLPVKLVDIPASEVAPAEKRAKRDHAEAVRGIARAAREAHAPQEQDHIEAAQVATKGGSN